MANSLFNQFLRIAKRRCYNYSFKLLIPEKRCVYNGAMPATLCLLAWLSGTRYANAIQTARRHDRLLPYTLPVFTVNLWL